MYADPGTKIFLIYRKSCLWKSFCNTINNNYFKINNSQIKNTVARYLAKHFLYIIYYNLYDKFVKYYGWKIRVIKGQALHVWHHVAKDSCKSKYLSLGLSDPAAQIHYQYFKLLLKLPFIASRIVVLHVDNGDDEITTN